MRLKVRTVARLARHFPDGATDGRAHFDLEDGATVADLFDLVALPDTRNYLVILNGTIVPRAKRRTARLSDGNALTILPKPKVG